MERPIGSEAHFRVQAQVFWRYIPNFVAPSSATGANPLATEVAQGVAEANALLLNTQDQSRTAGTLRLAYAEDSIPWEGEIFGIMNFLGGDYLIRPKLGYAWSDALKTSLGVEYYGGPEDRPLGALHSYSAVFGEGKMLF